MLNLVLLYKLKKCNLIKDSYVYSIIQIYIMHLYTIKIFLKCYILKMSKAVDKKYNVKWLKDYSTVSLK